MAETYIFSNDSIALVLGANDKNLSYLEFLLGSDIVLRGNAITIENSLPTFSAFLSKLEKIAKERGVLSESEIFMEYNQLGEPLDDLASFNDNKIGVISVSGKQVWAKSDNQRKLFRALERSQIVFATGPAGTGKTFISVAWALQEIFAGRKNKIVLTRPVVEAGESLGFLPGDLSQKLNPYLRPLYDAMEYLISPQQIKRLEENGAIEIAPLAYMRGRSLNNCIVILDEAQNTTSTQMRMFLTRLGENSQAIVTGDPTQVDLHQKNDSGLNEAIAILGGIDSISMIKFTHNDTVRSRIVREIVMAYSRECIDGNRI